MTDRKGSALTSAPTLTSLFLYGWIGGTPYKVPSSLFTADLGAQIAASPAKTTPVDADVLALSDSAASNAGKKLSWANLKATLKTYFDTLYSSGPAEYKQQPTSDVASVNQTGLSGHKSIECSYAFTVNNGSGSSTRQITLEARTAGGSYRALGNIASVSGLVSGNTSVFMGRFTIDGFNEANEKVVTGVGFASGDSQALDSSNAANSGVATNVVHIAAMPSWDEVWDEIRLTITTSGGSGATFEGSTADQRGYMFVRGY